MKPENDQLLNKAYEMAAEKLFGMIAGGSAKSLVAVESRVSEEITGRIRESMKESVGKIPIKEGNREEAYKFVDDYTLRERIGKLSSANARDFLKPVKQPIRD